MINSDSLVALKWMAFLKKHSKTYSSTEEHLLRFSIFKENLKKVEGHPNYSGATKFMDLTSEEFQQRYLTLKTNIARQKQFKSNPNNSLLNKNLQDDIIIDWTKKEAVTPVKDQE